MAMGVAVLALCTRSLDLHAKITRAGKPDANRFIFNGRFGGRKLTPGIYALTAVPAGGRPRTIAFEILR